MTKKKININIKYNIKNVLLCMISYYIYKKLQSRTN